MLLKMSMPEVPDMPSLMMPHTWTCCCNQPQIIDTHKAIFIYRTYLAIQTQVQTAAITIHRPRWQQMAGQDAAQA